MKKFDRDIQRHILSACITSYPYHPSIGNYDAEKFPKIMDGDILAANIYYLSERGLITITQQKTDDPYLLFENIKATADGIDFMLDDGGLGAILSVQTIRIHTDTMNQLESIISSLDIPEAEKTGLKAKLRELPASVLTQLMNDLSLKAVLSLPNALPLIQKYLQTLFP
ncbi:TPA: hypothetical protein ACS735_003613 [Providencia alcalifaciens]